MTPRCTYTQGCKPCLKVEGCPKSGTKITYSLWCRNRNHHMHPELDLLQNSGCTPMRNDCIRTTCNWMSNCTLPHTHRMMIHPLHLPFHRQTSILGDHRFARNIHSNSPLALIDSSKLKSLIFQHFTLRNFSISKHFTL